MMLFLRICQTFSRMKIKLLSLWMKPSIADIEVRASELHIYVHVLLVVMLCDMVVTQKSVS